MSHHIVVTAPALHDIRRAVAWWLTNRPDARTLVYNELRHAFDRLAEAPLSGVPDRHSRRPGLRYLLLLALAIVSTTASTLTR